MPYRSRIQSKNHNRLPVLAATVVLALVAALGAYVWLRHSSTPTSPDLSLNRGTATPNNNVPGGSNTGQNSSAVAPKGSAGGQSAGVPAASVQPAVPSGQFVSFHKPNLDSQPYPNTETSTCLTTPGVLCSIQFTMGTATKSLPAKRTNAAGSAIWNDWTLQSIGLTAGAWHVSAVAANGSKTATAHDATDLQVGP